MKGNEGTRGDTASRNLWVQHVIICEAQILAASPAKGLASSPSQPRQLRHGAVTAVSREAAASALPDEHCSGNVSPGPQL